MTVNLSSTRLEAADVMNDLAVVFDSELGFVLFLTVRKG